MTHFNGPPAGAAGHAPVSRPNGEADLPAAEHTHAAGALTLPATPGTSDAEASIAWLPAPLLPCLAAWLSLRDANALAATAKRYRQFAAMPQATERAVRLSGTADFIRLEQETRHAPPKVRQEVLASLAKHVARLPRGFRHEACAILAATMDDSPQALPPMLLALETNLLKDRAILESMAQRIKNPDTVDVLRIIAGWWRANDLTGDRYDAWTAVTRLADEAQMQITMRSVFESFRESAARALKAISDKL